MESALRQAAAQRSGAMLERLHTYVLQETPTGDTAALNAFADLLVDRYAELGCTARREPSETGDHVVADLPGRGRRADSDRLLFLGHHDTVWPVGQLADAMPWRDQDGVVYGPGVYDMKGGLVVLETALDLVAELGLDHRPVRIVVIADEEIGSPSARDLVTSEAAGAVAALGLESPHRSGRLKTARRGSTRVRIDVTGRESHAALDPGTGVSAIDELLDQLLAVRALVARYDDVLCNVGAIGGGGRTNVVPATASADLGLRFVDHPTEQAVLDALQGLKPIRDGAAVKVSVLSNRPAWQPSEAGDKLMADVARIARSIGQELDGAPAAGAADTNLTGRLGVPTLDGLGPLGQGAHAVHEQVVAASLPQRAMLVAALINGL